MESFSQLAAQHWQPGIGDPSLLGWTTVGLYAVAAAACLSSAFWARRANRTLTTKREPVVFWWIMTAIFAFLAVNKQLDLQTGFTFYMRGVVREAGLYRDRRELQRLFIYTFAGCGAVTLLLLFAVTWRHALRTWPTLTGLVIVSVYVGIRSASFHKVDHSLGDRVLGPLTINHSLEMPGIVLAIIGTGFAAWCIRRRISRATSLHPPDPAATAGRGHDHPI